MHTRVLNHSSPIAGRNANLCQLPSRPRPIAASRGSLTKLRERFVQLELIQMILHLLSIMFAIAALLLERGWPG